MIDLKPILIKSGLVVIDVQKGIVLMDRKLEPNTASTIVSNVSKLVGKFERKAYLFFSST